MKLDFLFVFSFLCLGLTSCYHTMGAGINAAYVQPSDTSADQTQDYQPRDTVYLKDGSIIHGFIVEEQPGISLKIKIKSGNIYMYQMADVAKITHRRQTDDDDTAAVANTDDSSSDDRK